MIPSKRLRKPVSMRWQWRATTRLSTEVWRKRQDKGRMTMTMMMMSLRSQITENDYSWSA